MLLVLVERETVKNSAPKKISWVPIHDDGSLQTNFNVRRQKNLIHIGSGASGKKHRQKDLIDIGSGASGILVDDDDGDGEEEEEKDEFCSCI